MLQHLCSPTLDKWLWRTAAAMAMATDPEDVDKDGVATSLEWAHQLTISLSLRAQSHVPHTQQPKSGYPTTTTTTTNQYTNSSNNGI